MHAAAPCVWGGGRGLTRKKKIPMKMELTDQPEQNVDRTFKLLLARGLLAEGDLVVVVSDIGPTLAFGPDDAVRSIQVRTVQG